MIMIMIEMGIDTKDKDIADVPPVLFVIFNRPHTTRAVFEAIRKAQPRKLYVAADGPRQDVPGDEAKCEESRKIATAVDWDCQVHTLFRDKNLGCGEGPCSAITWFFEHEPEGIILEDDCLPSQSFFRYCAELLAWYRDDTRIMEIAGNNLEKPHLREKEYSYVYSGLISSWGWATWRRAWKLQDFRMRRYPEITDKKYLEHIYDSVYERHFFRYIFSKMYRGDHRTNRKNIWDYQWQFACMINSGLVIVPSRNLIKNIGLGEQATNTTHAKWVGHDLKLEEMEFPCRHPGFVMVDKKRESRIFKLAYTSRTSRIKANVKRMVPGPILEKSLNLFRRLFRPGRPVGSVSATG